jgi:signal peptidase I
MSPSSLLLADPALTLLRPRPRAVVRRPARVAVSRPPRRLGRLPLVLGALLVLGVLGYLRMWPPLATVMSGSMEPTINTGDMVVLKRLVGPARVGQVVEVSVPDDARSRYGYPPVVIHRVVHVAPDGSVNTKGDARKEVDPFTSPRTALSATVVARIPAGGRLLAFLHSGMGLLWLGSGGLLFGGLPLLDRQRAARRREEDETVALRDQLAALSAELREDRQVLAELRDAIRSAGTVPTSASAETLPTSADLIEPPEEDGGQSPPPQADPLEQLALAIDVARGPAAADESAPQLAFVIEGDHAPRFSRPDERQLAFALDAEPVRTGQLVFSLSAPGSPWDAPPPTLSRLVAASQFALAG